MRQRERNFYDMLVRVAQFGADHAADFPAASLGGENFAAVNEALADVRRNAATQTSGGIENAVATKAALREAIREKLRLIVRTARAIALDKPAIAGLFQMPAGRNGPALVATARQLAATVSQFATDFGDYGLPANLAADLGADLDAFEQTLNEKAAAQGERASATAGIDANLDNGLNAARRLDALVRNRYLADASKLAAWQSARHVQRSPRAARPATLPSTPPPAPLPTP